MFKKLLVLLTLLLVGGVVQAQTVCTVGGTTTCFTASKATGESPLSTTLTWNIVGGVNCTAAGTGSWTGSIPSSGIRNLSGVKIDMHLTLVCSVPGSAKMDWTTPTANRDGSTLNDLGGYRVMYGVSAASLTQSVDLSNPAINTYTVQGLASGTWFFSVAAKTSSCFQPAPAICREGDPSNVASKAIVTGTYNGAVDLDVFTVPTAPTNLTVSDPIAYEIRTDSTGKLLAQRVGLVPVGSLCACGDQQIVAGVTYSRVDRGLLQPVNFSNGPAGGAQWMPVIYAVCA